MNLRGHILDRETLKRHKANIRRLFLHAIEVGKREDAKKRRRKIESYFLFFNLEEGMQRKGIGG